MNFAKWLLRRIQTSLFGRQWNWIERYRELIMEEKAVSVVVTLLGTAFWAIASIPFMLWINSGDRIPIEWLLYSVSIPVMFYLYNWIAALYMVYCHEREQVWNVLKDQA